MTEAEWNCCTKPQPMLEFLAGKASERKLRLFGCACCRRIWHLLADERSRNAVEITERFADGLVGVAELRQAACQAKEAISGPGDCWRAGLDRWRESGLDAKLIDRVAWNAVNAASACWAITIVRSEEVGPVDVAEAAACSVGQFPAADQNEEMAQCGLIRCVFGPLPFRQVNSHSTGLTPHIVTLAQDIYNQRAFDRLPLLAKALEDTGCTNQDILDHCRQPGEHARGCWILDLLLGKEQSSTV